MKRPLSRAYGVLVCAFILFRISYALSPRLILALYSLHRFLLSRLRDLACAFFLCSIHRFLLRAFACAFFLLFVKIRVHSWFLFHA